MRATLQRIAILRAIEPARAFAIEEIRARLGSEEADTATVYRAVSAFERAGLLHCLRVDGGERYFLCGGPAGPSHACEGHDDVSVSYCRNCSRVRETHRHHHPDGGDVLSCREERVLARCADCAAG